MLQALATPSAIMHWLLMLLPVTILFAALCGWIEREKGNRRLTASAGLTTLWLFLPIRFEQVELQQISAMISMLAWLGLIGAWAHHVWTRRPTPVWAQALVVSHLVAVAIGAIVAVLRAALA